MTVDALDQSWGRVDPNAAKASGIKLIAGYLSYDTSKNWTADWIRRYHAVGIGVLLNWEAVQDAPFEGAARGTADAQEAVRQAQALIAAVGKPSGPIGIVFSVDRDTNPSQYPALDAYFAATRAVTHAAGFLNGVYGEADLMDHLHNAGFTDVEWQTLAWSYGRISQYTDLYQSSINNLLNGTSIDNDRILNAPGTGAWWPAGSSESTDSNGATPIGDDSMSAADVAALEAFIKSHFTSTVKPAIVNASVAAQNKTQATATALGDQMNTLAKSTVAAVHKDNVTVMGPTIDRVSHLYGDVQQILTDLASVGAATGTALDLAPVIAKLDALSKHLGA